MVYIILESEELNVEADNLSADAANEAAKKPKLIQVLLPLSGLLAIAILVVRQKE